MKKIFFIIVFVVATTGNSALAQSPALQEALEGVETQVTELVTAKDTEKPDELTQRIETFKKVVRLSVSETKDLKIKLLALEKIGKEMIAWQKQMIEILNDALAYYEEQLENLDNPEKIDLAGIKNIASDFKKWRDENYLPVAGEINEFFLIEQEQKAIATAEKRAGKIEKDIAKLEKTKFPKVTALKELLARAKSLIAAGKTINNEAQEIFFEQYLTEFVNTSATSTLPREERLAATSTVETILASSTPLTETGTSTTSTISQPEGTPVPIPLPPSIKDLVENSLMKIKEAYQVFIEMSNLVRKLFS